MRLAGGGIHHGSVVEVGDLESSQHASITVYHQPKDVLVDNSDDGYLILNPEAVETIRKTREEGEEGEEGEIERESESEESGDSDCVEEESGESEDDCVEVVDPRDSQKRERGSDADINKRVEICLPVFYKKN